MNVLAAAAAALAAGTASGAAAAPPRRAATAAYPVAVRLVIAPEVRDARHFHSRLPATTLLHGDAIVPVGVQAADAYAIARERMFGGEGAPSAELVPAIAETGIDLDSDGWFAWVEHDVVLREAEGAEIARWRVRGQGRIAGLGEAALPRAFAEAAAYAARTLEWDFERPPAVAAWLAARGIPPGTRAAALPSLPRRFTPPPPVVVPPRTGSLVFAELGGSAAGAGGWLSSAGALRAGWSGSTWLVEAALDAWPRSFVARPPVAWGEARAHANVMSAGVDVGVLRPLSRRLDLAAGVGAAVLAARAGVRYVPLSDPDASAARSFAGFGIDGSAFLAARLNTVIPGFGARIRLGLEVRQALGTGVPLPELRRTLGTTRLSGTVLAGLELPR